MPLNFKSSLEQAYIRDLGNGGGESDLSYRDENILYFDFIPEEIPDNVSTNWNPVEIPGRSEPIMGYVSTSAREFSLHLIFTAGIGQRKHPGNHSSFVSNTEGISPDEDGAASVKQKVDWLRSLTYPDYTNTNFLRPPHKVLVSLGRLIKSVCLVMSVNSVYKMPWDENLLPYMAEVDISFQEINEIPLGRNLVRRGILSSL